MNENEFATGSVPVMVAARIYGKDASWVTLPLEVLMDHYWPKSYAKRIPEFTEHVLEYYEKWQNDELDMDKLKEDLWVYGGVRLEEVEGK